MTERKLGSLFFRKGNEIVGIDYPMRKKIGYRLFWARIVGSRDIVKGVIFSDYHDEMFNRSAGLDRSGSMNGLDWTKKEKQDEGKNSMKIP